MPQLTNAIAKGLDAKRRVLLGASASLALLDHLPASGRGYGKLIDVEAGWYLKRGDVGEVSTLTIAESETVTFELIKKAVAFSISGKVWKRVENEYSSPEGETFRIWRFNVQPTGEKFFGES